MASNDKGVPRGDNVPASEQADSVKRQDANTRGEGVASDAAARVDARDGKSPATPEPDTTKGSDRGGTSGWGGEASGGSVIDTRAPK